MSGRMLSAWFVCELLSDPRVILRVEDTHHLVQKRTTGLHKDEGRGGEGNSSPDRRLAVCQICSICHVICRALTTRSTKNAPIGLAISVCPHAVHM